MYGSGDIKPNRLIFLSFWAIFCHFFYPCNSPKNQNIYKRKKKKNAWIYHHFTQVYQNHNPRLYCSWDMAHDGCNYFSFWTIFCSFTAEKIKISKKMKKKKKKNLEISFYTSVPKIMTICYTILEIWHVTNVIVLFCFGQFFTLLPL